MIVGFEMRPRPTVVFCAEAASFMACVRGRIAHGASAERAVFAAAFAAVAYRPSVRVTA